MIEEALLDDLDCGRLFYLTLDVAGWHQKGSLIYVILSRVLLREVRLVTHRLGDSQSCLPALGGSVN